MLNDTKCTTQSGTPSTHSKVTVPKRAKPYTMDIPIAQLLPWDGNPTARTNDLALRELLTTVQESALITELAGVNNGDDTVTLGDGHRRLAVGTALGWKKLTCRVFPDSYTPADLYQLLNHGVRRQFATDVLEAYILGDVLPRNQKLASSIKFCVRLCGSKEATRRIMLDGDRRITPNIATTIYSAVTFLEGASDRSGKGGQVVLTPRHHEVFAWIVKHGDQLLKRVLATPVLTEAQKRKRIVKALRDDASIEVV